MPDIGAINQTGWKMKEPNIREVERIFDQAPFIRDLGLSLELVAHGECRTKLTVTERHLQQDGFIHAGVLAAIADHTAGAAGSTLVEKGQFVLTAEFKINFLSAAKGTHLYCISKVLKPGKVLTVVESELYCGSTHAPRLVSKATVTLAIVARRGGTTSGVD
jgi:uncharacterized protein (TIGR00369 family)